MPTAGSSSRGCSWISTGDRAFVSADGRTGFQLLYPVPDFTSSDLYATALPRLDGAVGGGSSVLAETLLAGAGALAVLAVVFGSLIAVTPLVIAAVAIPSAFGFIYALTYAITVSTLVQNIVALIGLGVAIDYALLIVTRWREERGRGLDNCAAVLRASATAGSSVLFSGVTVAVSLAALAMTSVPFLRSIGLAAMLIPLISIAVSATLLPVVLDAAGPALEWPRRRPTRTVSPLWTAIARRVTARPGWSAAGALAILAVLIVPVFWLNLGEPQATAAAATAPAGARAGLAALVSGGIGPGVLRPAEILLPPGASASAPGGRSPWSRPPPGPRRPAHCGRLIDATVIRGVLAPALVALLGRANWWLPRPAARLLRVTPLTARATHGSPGRPAAPGPRPAGRHLAQPDPQTSKIIPAAMSTLYLSPVQRTPGTNARTSNIDSSRGCNPAEGRHALRLDLPDAQVDVVLRNHGLVLRPHVAVPLERNRDDGTAARHRSRVIIRCRGLRLIGGRAMGTSRKSARRGSRGAPPPSRGSAR